MYDTYLGRLGNPVDGINVARVEVSWYDEVNDSEGDGYWIVHAVGDEPECQGEDGTIYAVFEALVYAAMDARVKAGRFDWWAIEDISSV